MLDSRDRVGLTRTEADANLTNRDLAFPSADDGDEPPSSLRRVAGGSAGRGAERTAHHLAAAALEGNLLIHCKRAGFSPIICESDSIVQNALAVRAGLASRFCRCRRGAFLTDDGQLVMKTVGGAEVAHTVLVLG